MNMTQKLEPRVAPGESQLYRMAAPDLARKLRRKALYAGLLGIVLGVVAGVVGANGMRTGELVRFGSVSNGPDLPGSLVVLIGVFLVCVGGMVIWRNVIRPR